MTDDKRQSIIKALIKTYTETITVSKTAARAALINEGIYRKNGTLRPQFGGTPRKPKNAA